MHFLGKFQQTRIIRSWDIERDEKLFTKHPNCTGLKKKQLADTQFDKTKRQLASICIYYTGWPVKHGRVCLVPWISVHMYRRIIFWTFYFMSGIRKTRPCLTGHPVCYHHANITYTPTIGVPWRIIWSDKYVWFHKRFWKLFRI